MSSLDTTDLRMALTAANYYIRAWELGKRPVPPAAHRLVDHLTCTLAASGPQPVVPQQHWLTTRQVADHLGCSQRHARRIATRVGTKIGRQWLVDPDALEDT